MLRFHIFQIFRICPLRVCNPYHKTGFCILNFSWKIKKLRSIFFYCLLLHRLTGNSRFNRKLNFSYICQPLFLEFLLVLFHSHIESFPVIWKSRKFSKKFLTWGFLVSSWMLKTVLWYLIRFFCCDTVKSVAPKKIIVINVTRLVKGCIPDRIFHPHFLPIFGLNLRKKGMENPRKSHPFYKPGCYHW
jgi:hypothetical protein